MDMRPPTDIRAISVPEHLGAITDLLREHWAETEHDVIDTGPAPLVEGYQLLENAGISVALGAFEGDVMVGYCTAMVAPHLHYSVLYAAHDALFVRADRRNSTIGLRLINAMRRECKARGVQFMSWTAKPGSTFGQILQKQGCVEEEIVYIERF